MGGAMLSKSLIQFSVDGWGRVPSLLFHLRPNCSGSHEEDGDLPKVPCMHSCTQSPDPAAGHNQPTLMLETPGHSWASLGQSLVGSLPLSPRSWHAQGFVCALQASVSPALCKFWQLYDGVIGDLLRERLCHTQFCCTQSPCPCGSPLQPVPLQETLKHSSGSVSVESLGPGAHKVCLSPPSISGRYGV